VPETYSFWDLHVAIQDSMGWLDGHLHEIEVPDPRTREVRRIGIPDDEWEDDNGEVLEGWNISMAHYLNLRSPVALYSFILVGWEHRIRMEAIAPREQGRKYPRCLKGARACPPEDVGGVYGY